MHEQDTDEFLAPEGLTVFRDESNNLCARIAGRGEWTKVALRLAFPYSDPDHYVALVCDGEEIGMVRDPEELDPDSRALVREELKKRYHVPEILRVLDVRDQNTAAVWTVETEKGVRQLLVRDRHNFRRFREGDVVIVDVDGNRFRLRRDRAFDRESRRLIDNYG